LDALEGTVEGLRQRLRQRGFADSGNVFDKQMAARQQRDQRQLDHVFLAEDCSGNGTLQLRDRLRGYRRHWLKSLPHSCYKYIKGFAPVFLPRKAPYPFRTGD